MFEFPSPQLAKLIDAALDNKRFPWLTSQVVEVGNATDVYALRVSFIGELGWEPHFPIKYAGYYGHLLGKSLALGYIDAARSAVGTGLEIEIPGRCKRASVLIASPLDPENKKLRA